MSKRLFSLTLSIIVLVSGFIMGTNISFATTGNFFAGYESDGVNTGVLALIPYKNPSMTSASTGSFTTEWVMASDVSANYIQAGWIKFKSDSQPKYFVEYSGCAVLCRTFWGTIDSNSHYYKVQKKIQGSSVVWCGYIDDVEKTCGNTTTIGFIDSTRALFSGETTDTNAKLGGTSSSPFKMTILEDQQFGTGNWYQVNTTSITNITTSGTKYRASTGFDTTTWMKNWTQ